MSHDTGYETVAHLYDLFDRKDNIELFFRSAAGEILDIGAGTGRIAIPPAERGMVVYCVEPSPAMRREFEMKLSQRPDLGQRITLVAGDARSFGFGGWVRIGLSTPRRGDDLSNWLVGRI